MELELVLFSVFHFHFRTGWGLTCLDQCMPAWARSKLAFIITDQSRTENFVSLENSTLFLLEENSVLSAFPLNHLVSLEKFEKKLDW